MHILNVHSQNSSGIRFNSYFDSKTNINASEKLLSDVLLQKEAPLLKMSLQNNLPSVKSILSAHDNQNLSEAMNTAVESDINAFDACLDLINNDNKFDKIFQGMDSLEQAENLLPFMIPPDQQMLLNANLSQGVTRSDLSTIPFQNTANKKNDNSTIHFDNFQFESDKTHHSQQSDCNMLRLTDNVSGIREPKLTCSKSHNINAPRISPPKGDVTFTELAEMIKVSLNDGVNTEMDIETGVKALKENKLDEKTLKNFECNLKNVVQSGCFTSTDQMMTGDNVDTGKTVISQKLKLKCGYCDKTLSSTTCLKKHTAKFHNVLAPKYTKVTVTERKVNLSPPLVIPQSSVPTIKSMQNVNSSALLHQTDSEKCCAKINVSQSEVSSTRDTIRGACKSPKTPCNICGKMLTQNYMKCHMKKLHADSLQISSEIKLEELETLSSSSKGDNKCKNSVLDSTNFAVSTVQEQDIDSSTCLSTSDALQRNACFNVSEASVLPDKHTEDSLVKFNFNNIEFSKGSDADVKSIPIENSVPTRKLNSDSVSSVKPKKGKGVNSQITSKPSKQLQIFSCIICEKSFKHKGNLTRHMKKKHGYDPQKDQMINQDKAESFNIMQVMKQSCTLSPEALPSKKLPGPSEAWSKKSGTLKVISEKESLLKSVLHSNFISKQFQSKEISSTSPDSSHGGNVLNDFSSTGILKLSDGQPSTTDSLIQENKNQQNLNTHILQPDLMLSNEVSNTQQVDSSNIRHMPTESSFPVKNDNSSQKESLNYSNALNPLQSHVSEFNIKLESENSSVVMPISAIISNVTKCNFGGAPMDIENEEVLDDNSLKLTVLSPDKSPTNTNNVAAYEFSNVDRSSPNNDSKIDRSPNTLCIASTKYPSCSSSVVESSNHLFTLGQASCVESVASTENYLKTFLSHPNTALNLSGERHESHNLFSVPASDKKKYTEVASFENEYHRSIMEDTVDLVSSGSLDTKQSVPSEFSCKLHSDALMEKLLLQNASIEMENKVRDWVSESCFSSNISENKIQSAHNIKNKINVVNHSAEKENCTLDELSGHEIDEFKVTKINNNVTLDITENENRIITSNDRDINSGLNHAENVSLSNNIPEIELDNVIENWNIVSNNIPEKQANVSVHVPECEIDMSKLIGKSTTMDMNEIIEKEISRSEDFSEQEKGESKDIVENRIGKLADISQNEIVESTAYAESKVCMSQNPFENYMNVLNEMTIIGESTTINMNKTIKKETSRSEDFFESEKGESEDIVENRIGKLADITQNEMIESTAKAESKVCVPQNTFENYIKNEITENMACESNVLDQEFSMSLSIIEKDMKEENDVSETKIGEVDDNPENEISASNGITELNASNDLSGNDISISNSMVKEEVDVMNNNIKKASHLSNYDAEAEIPLSNAVIKSEITDSTDNVENAYQSNNDGHKSSDVEERVSLSKAENRVFNDENSSQNMESNCSSNIESNSENICSSIDSTFDSSEQFCDLSLESSNTFMSELGGSTNVHSISGDVVKKNTSFEISCQFCLQKFASLDTLLKHLQGSHHKDLSLDTLSYSSPKKKPAAASSELIMISTPSLKLSAIPPHISSSVTNSENINISIASASGVPIEVLKENCNLTSTTEQHSQAKMVDTNLENRNPTKKTATGVQLNKPHSSNLNFNASRKNQLRRYSFSGCSSSYQWNPTRLGSTSPISPKFVKPSNDFEPLKVRSISLPNLQFEMNPVITIRRKPVVKKTKIFPRVESDNSSTRGYSVSDSSYSPISESNSSASSSCFPNPLSNSKLKAAHRKLLFQKIRCYRSQRHARKRTKTDCCKLFCCSKSNPVKQMSPNKCKSSCKRGRPRKVFTFSKPDEISTFLRSRPYPVVILTRLEDSVVHQYSNKPPVKKAVVKLERLQIANKLELDSEKLDFGDKVTKPSKPKKENLLAKNNLNICLRSPEILHTSTVLKRSAPIIIDLTDSNSASSSKTLSRDSQSEEYLECSVETEKGYSELLKKKCRVVLKRVLV